MPSDSVSVDRIFNASREQLYGIWTDASHMSRWFGVKVDANPIIGGSLVFHFASDDLTQGEYLLLVPHDALSFTWFSRGSDTLPTGRTQVTVVFSEAPGGTRMKVIHQGLMSEHARKDHLEGWTEYFNKWEMEFSK